MNNGLALEVKSSRLPGFYKLELAERIAVVAEWAGLNEDERAVLAKGGLQPGQADLMIENVVGTYALPLGIAANFLVNGRDYLIPMAVEEPSVLAAISHAAKLIRAGGGFQAESTEPIMIGQIQVLDMPDLEAAHQAVLAHSDELMALADVYGESIVRFGGGARGIEARSFSDTAVGPMLVVHLLFDTRDAMGANSVNTAVEGISPRVAELTGGRAVLRILSNLADRRTTTASCTIPADELTLPDIPGATVARLIAEANAFAVADPYRAATHNKGIMNGIDAVCIATGNDWRAIEAGAHSYAAFHGQRRGTYSALTDWHVVENGDLYGEITLPLAVGTVGGATKVHPTAKVALKILAVESAAELAEVIASVGLAQNLAAIRALATHGIQRGHMRLHARQVALAAGAVAAQVQAIADQLVAEGNIDVERARELLTNYE
jgi:hydroxymethylglutaryl-CoA reductase